MKANNRRHDFSLEFQLLLVRTAKLGNLKVELFLKVVASNPLWFQL
jgi:hypothetical protein